MTDKDGDVLERIDYFPFGEIARDWINGPDSNYEKVRNKYTGQMWDYNAGLYHCEARYYDPEIGRFTQASAITECGGQCLSPACFSFYLVKKI